MVYDTAITGILYNKGIIKDLDDLNEIQKNIDIINKLSCPEKEQRKKFIEELENGQFTV
jgi:hypothetical protein